LAKAAFKNGFEEYGYDIIKRMKELYKKDKAIYFLYNRKTAENQESGGGPSAWGAAAILNAIDEGLAGIEDLDVKYNILGFSPRFIVTEYKQLRYITGYEKSNITIDINYELKECGMLYEIKASSSVIKAHILLPKNKKFEKLLVNGKNFKTSGIEAVGESNYINFTFEKNNAENVKIEIYF